MLSVWGNNSEEVSMHARSGGSWVVGLLSLSLVACAAHADSRDTGIELGGCEQAHGEHVVGPGDVFQAEVGPLWRVLWCYRDDEQSVCADTTSGIHTLDGVLTIDNSGSSPDEDVWYVVAW